MGNEVETHRVRKALIVLVVLTAAGLVAQLVRYLQKD